MRSTQNLHTLRRRRKGFLGPPWGRPEPPEGGPEGRLKSLMAEFLGGGGGFMAGGERGLGRGRGLRCGRGAALQALLAVAAVLVEALVELVGAHGQELDDRLADAQPALEFADGLGAGLHVEE